MPDQNRDPDAALRKLGHHVRLGWKKTNPTPDKTLESIRKVIREKWDRKEARASVSDDGTLSFLCPTCFMKLKVKLNERRQAADDLECPSCRHLIPRSFIDALVG